MLKSYMERLIKLIPAEVIGVYLTVKGFFVGPDGGDQATAFLQVWPLICLLLVIAVRCWGTRDASGSLQSVQFVAVGIATVSFAIWIYAMGDHFFHWKLDDQRYASAAVVLWTFVLSIFYRGS